MAAAPDRFSKNNLSRTAVPAACWAVAGVCLLTISAGCASRYGHLMASNDKDLVGSHQAGAATWNPLVDQSVAQLLGRCPPPNESVIFPEFAGSHPPGGAPEQAGVPAKPVGHQSRLAEVEPLPPPQGSVDSAWGEMPTGPQITGPQSTGPQSTGPLATGPARVCFIGIENKSAEELLDFKDQLYERIDSQINGSANFRSISRRMVDAALIETRLRPDSLFLPDNRAAFAAVLGRQGTPVDYLLYATITSGTTDRNRSTQRDYVLTLEMINLHTGDYLKESAKIRKGYHKSRAGKWWNFGLFDQADG